MHLKHVFKYNELVENYRYSVLCYKIILKIILVLIYLKNLFIFSTISVVDYFDFHVAFYHTNENEMKGCYKGE